MLAQTVGVVEILVVLLYLFLVVYLGWLGYSRTKTAADYLIAGRKIHPFVMAMSYGATFISTSAIVGFGGAAALLLLRLHPQFNKLPDGRSARWNVGLFAPPLVKAFQKRLRDAHLQGGVFGVVGRSNHALRHSGNVCAVVGKPGRRRRPERGVDFLTNQAMVSVGVRARTSDCPPSI